MPPVCSVICCPHVHSSLLIYASAADAVPFLVSSDIELNMAVFCACMPSIRSLLAKTFSTDCLSWVTGVFSRGKTSWPSTSGTMPDRHDWRYDQQSQDSLNVPGRIRVTHLTSVTSMENEGDTRMGNYYPLQDMDPVLRQSQRDGPRAS